MVKRLDSVAIYIKDKYLLKYKNFDTNLKDAHVEYTEFCNLNNIKGHCKIEFNKKLESYKIISYKCGNIHNKFNIKHEKLDVFAQKTARGRAGGAAAAARGERGRQGAQNGAVS